jgi:glucans biosynthesis protein C
MNSKLQTRRYDLDWLRVLAILTVFLYHSTRFFNYSDWHVKNPVTYAWVQAWDQVASTWLMPFIFLISGASLFFALGKAQIKWSIVPAFIKDKFLRLFVPLLVGVFSHAALQVYLERLSHGEFRGSFFQFIPHYFDGIYGFGGNFAVVGNHLWYLFVLFFMSLACLPLFLLLKSQKGAAVLGKVTHFLGFPGGIYLLMLVTLIFFDNISPDSFLGFDKFGNNLGVYLTYFICGFVIYSSERLQQGIRKVRWVSLLGCIVFTVIQVLTGEQDEFLGWFTILTFLGFGMQHLSASKPMLKYANEAVLPFYVLHQSVLLVVGFFVVRWVIPDLLKWALITASSLVIIAVLYEFLVRRVNVLRFLFGMKLLEAAAQPQAQAEALKRVSPTA